MHAAKGQELQAAGKYEEAIDEYLKAYALVPHPLLLFDMAQCYRLKGDYATAAEHYEKYLAAEPKGRAAPQAREQLAATRAKLAELEAEKRKAEAVRKQRQEEDGKKKAAEAKRLEVERERQAEARRQQQAQQHAALTRQTQSAGPKTDEHGSSSPGRTLEIGGIVATAAGAVLAGTGVYYGIHASSLSDELSQNKSTPWTNQELQEDAEGRAAQRNMLILTITGGVAVVGGVVLYLWGRKHKSHEQAVSLRPVVSPRFAGVVLLGGF